MGNRSELVGKVLIRLLIASPLFLIQIFLIRSWPAFGVIAGLPFGFGGALIVAPRLLELLAEPFRSLFYPLHRFDKPVPMYSIPQGMRFRGEYEAALAYYEKMELEYPGDLQVYHGMLQLLLLEMKDPDKASAVFERALHTLKTAEQREGLSRVYQGLLSQAKGRPEWLTKQKERILQTSPADGVPVKEPDGLAQRRFHSGGHYRRENE